jgi:hypothetical protein
MKPLPCLGCGAWFNVILAGIDNLIQRISYKIAH